ncbi:oxygen regulatory protein NreC (plasmid) [Fulvitalea axinellae]|uniref:Oxygen regulatory protein NreC n=1 Tax=Fulvitalea axinellae TaxID=1182444 RepID=A0AAU9CLN9_9BACT|nr:oxygen regulatory protein NreC [Fulvitalea axinellae]
MNNKAISLAIVDDDALIVSLLKEFLDAKEGISVAFTAESGVRLLERLKENAPHPDVIILDLKMKGENGADTCAFIKEAYPHIRTIVMSSHYQDAFTGFMVKSGALAFIPKGISPTKLLEVIVSVHEKGFYFLPEQMDIVRKQLSSKTPKPVFSASEKLSDRESEILTLICKQKTSKEIGEALFISPRTVEGHKKTLLRKTGSKNVVGLVLYAFRHKLVDDHDLSSPI